MKRFLWILMFILSFAVYGKVEIKVEEKKPVVKPKTETKKSTPTKKTTTKKTVPIELGYVYVEGGTFTMGDTFGDGYDKEKPIHSVTLDSFYISKYEVTQKEYRELMGYNPSWFSVENNPVEQVTWYEAVMYANKLSEKEGLKPYYNISSITKEGNRITNATVTIAGGKGYRLPTESEWEYAARGGKESKGYRYSGSNNFDEVAWLANYDSKNITKNVGQKKSNELGIYDMSGNAGEWCFDWYGDYSSSSETNPMGPKNGYYRVGRGRRFDFDSGITGSVSDRFLIHPAVQFSMGFRLVRSADEKWAFVQGGTFTMGDTFGGGYSDEKPTHSVTLDSYYMSKYEVTQKEYREVMGYNPSSFSGDNNPVEMVTWYDAVMYANKLSEKEGLKPYYNISSITKDGNRITNATVTIAGGKGYRLPTESEWEYAARGGNQSKGYKYSGGNTIGEVAEHEGNNNKSTKPVGGKKANELGIYDMSGNVWEWCWDWYGSYTSSNKTNPAGPASGANRVHRGGSWNFAASYATVTYRRDYYPSFYDYVMGFRLVRAF